MSLFKSGFIVAFFTLISRVFGLLRELFIAHIFGSGWVADSVNVAFKLPNFFRRIFAEGAFSAAFIPLFNQKLNQSHIEAKKYTANIAIILTITLVILTALTQLLMPYCMLVIAPGFYATPEKFDFAVMLARITMPYLIFISLVALYGGVLNSLGNFVAFSASPILMNIILILSTYMLGKMHFNIAIAFAYSIIIAGITQLIVICFSCYKHNMFSLFIKPRFNNDAKILLQKMTPAALSSSVTQINIFISQSIASFIPGAVSILSYADRLYQFPLSIIGISFSTVLLPMLSKAIKENNIQQIKNLQNQSFQIACFLSIPAATGIYLLAESFIKIIYEHGAFTALDSVNTSIALKAYCLGLPAFILLKVITPNFYANLNTKQPLYITIQTIILNCLANIILMNYYGTVGIALGTSIAAWFNFIQLYRLAQKNNYLAIQFINLVKYISKVLIANIIMSFVVILFLKFLPIDFSMRLTTIIQILIIVSSAFSIYIFAALKLKLIDTHLIRNLLSRKNK